MPKSIHTVIFALILFNVNAIGQSCLVSNYSFNGNANDLVSSNNGIVYGATPTTDRNGNPNSAYYFDGINDHIDFSTDFDFAQRTIMFWFNASTISTSLGCMFEADHNAMAHSQTEIGVRNISGSNKLSICIGSPANNWSTPLITPNSWHHIAVVRDISEIRYYLDCQLIATKYDMSNIVSNQSNNPFASLGMTSTNSNFFNGIIDELKIYNCALNSTEINNECVQSTGIGSSINILDACEGYNGQNYLFTCSTSVETFFGKTQKNYVFKSIHDITGKEIFNSSKENVTDWLSTIKELPNGVFVYTIDCGSEIKKGYFIINYN